MKKITITVLLGLCATACVKQPETSFNVSEGQRIIEKPAVINVSDKIPSAHLIVGNDRLLEKAFSQYSRTGKAPNVSADGFVKFAYNVGQQPIIKTTPFQETVISLEPGERFTNISSGDPNRWSYSVAISGSGGTQQQNVLVKPSFPGIGTNMVITTDKRIYNIRLLSTKKSSANKNISFWYPEDIAMRTNEIALSQADEPKVSVVPDVSLSTLNFNYSVDYKGSYTKPSWHPTRVFDDGVHTYIQFSDSVSSQDLPALFVLNNDSKELVNYRAKLPYFVVDKIFERAALVMGTGKSQKCITIMNHRLI